MSVTKQNTSDIRRIDRDLFCLTILGLLTIVKLKKVETFSKKEFRLVYSLALIEINTSDKGRALIRLNVNVSHKLP